MIADAMASPTMTSPAATRAGVILGTAAYMSPEQAKGRTADTQCDVWAFGCVLYEMLTGRAAFAGETVSEVLGEILKSEPDWQLATTGDPRWYSAFTASVPSEGSGATAPPHRGRASGD